MAIAPLPSAETLPPPQIWMWQGQPITYQTQGTQGPAVILVHGFGASWGHWRKNIPVLAATCRVYALDLLGFGGSAKPAPGNPLPYTFETWSQQIADFCREVVGTPTVLVGNSIGCIAAMQAAVDAPDWFRSVVAINCSLRMLHDRRRADLPWYRRLGAPLLQSLLGVRWIGHGFFRLIARPSTVRSALKQAYVRPEAITEELVDLLLTPARDAGAADVFLAFTRYSQGPLPEDLLAILPCPALLIWGEADPWEPIEQGKQLAHFPCVKAFIPIPQAGHCPQDEAPEAVNPILLTWLEEPTALDPAGDSGELGGEALP
ncbi:MAG: alpha/beta fold hydrolase [Synechococcales bacterium]|nr:alpha/beta fold hydrolase [Synechococcales bacterium]